MPTASRLRTLGLLALAVLCAGLAGRAAAQPYSVGGALGFSHESNLFRAADDAVLGEGSSRSDRSTVASVFAALDQPLGRQRLYGNASLRSNRFARNERLDYDGYALGLGLDWSSAERVSGNLNANAARTLRPFGTIATVIPETRKNLQTDGTVDAILRVGVVSEWTVEGTLSWGETGYSEAAFSGEELQRSGGSVGLRWRPGGSSSLGLAVRQTDGRYPHRGASFARTELDLTGTWQPSGASGLALRLSPGRTRNRSTDGGASANSATTGSLNWRWQATGKVALTSQIIRSTSQDSFNQRLLAPGPNSSVEFVQAASANNTRSTLYQVVADWEISAKLSASASLTQVRRSISRTGDFRTGEFDRDNTRRLSVALRWNPLRSVQLACEAGTESRSAGGLLSAPYDARNLGCTAQISFQ